MEITHTNCRTKSGTEIHRAFTGSSRTDCGCRVNTTLTHEQMLKAQAHGILCLKCFGPHAKTDTPEAWAARFA